MSLNSQSVVVITGAASGIGRALAVQFAKEKVAGIAISDVNEQGLSETAEIATKLGAEVFSSVMDVSKLEEFQNFANQTVVEIWSCDTFNK